MLLLYVDWKVEHFKDGLFIDELLSPNDEKKFCQ